MKKTLFPLLAALALTIGTATAQDGRPAQGRERPNSEEQTARLTKELGLSPDQAARIKAINTERESEMKAAHGQGKEAGSREKMGEQMKADREKYDARYKEVLTADQYAKFSKMQGGHGGKGGPGGPGADGKLKAKNGKVKMKTNDN